MTKKQLAKALELSNTTGQLVGVGHLTCTPQARVLPFDTGLQGVILSDSGESSTKIKEQNLKLVQQDSIVRSLNRKFAPIFQDNKLVISQGGRGSGKTKSAGWAAILETYKPLKRNVLVLRFNQQTIKDSIYNDIENELDQFGLRDDFEFRNTEIVNTLTGSAILFKGIKSGQRDVKDKLKGIPRLSYILIEEAADLNEGFSETLLLLQGSMRDAGYFYRIQIVLNPADKSHAIYKKYLATHPVGEPNEYVNGAYFISTTYKDNGGLTEHYLETIRLEKLNEPKAYAWAFGGEWKDVGEGQIITNFSVGEFKEVDRLTCVGIDFGFTDPTAAVLCNFDRKTRTAYLKLVVNETQLTEEDLAYRLSEVREHYLYCDNARPEIIRGLTKRGYKAKGAKKPKVEESIRSMADWHFVVDTNSPDIVEAFNSYNWDKRRPNVPDHRNSHIPDAIRYAFVEIVGLNKGEYFVH